MKILLDECVTRKAKKLLAEYDVYTVAEMGFSGLKNGKLLAQAELNNFDILLTIDKNMNYQQDIGKFELILVVFDVFRSNLRYIEELIPSFKAQINDFQTGKAYKIVAET